MISQRQLFLQYIAQTSPEPVTLEIVRARGVKMYDQNGKMYYDLISGINVSAVGHCHPQVVKAIHQQASKFMHLMVYGELVQSPQVQLAQKLVDLLPQPLDNVYFLNSGTEAIEAAIKLLRKFTGRTEIICFSNAYHGSTFGALSLIGDEKYKAAFRPVMPGIKTLPFNDIAALEQITNNTAGVIIETIQGEAGVLLPGKVFMHVLRKRCNETGALLVLDEIQCGMGRTGLMFAFQHYGIVPDIITLAKGLGGGLPLSATISSRHIMSVFKENPALNHITTFGGNPLCCAASLATIQVIEYENLLQRIEEKEMLFRSLLQHHAIQEVRGKGLMLCIRFESASINKAVIDKCIENGLFTDWFLFAEDCLRISPPLTITKDEISQVCNILIKSIHQAMMV